MEEQGVKAGHVLKCGRSPTKVYCVLVPATFSWFASEKRERVQGELRVADIRNVHVVDNLGLRAGWDFGWEFTAHHRLYTFCCQSGEDRQAWVQAMARVTAGELVPPVVASTHDSSASMGAPATASRVSSRFVELEMFAPVGSTGEASPLTPATPTAATPVRAPSARTRMCEPQNVAASWVIVSSAMDPTGSFRRFRINVQWGPSRWAVFRRYKQFRELYSAVNRSGVKVKGLPPKNHHRGMTAAELQKRIDGLNAFLRSVSCSRHSIVRHKKAWTTLCKWMSPLQLGDQRDESYVSPI